MGKQEFRAMDRHLRAAFRNEARCNIRAEMNGGNGLPPYAAGFYRAWRGWYGWRAVDAIGLRGIGDIYNRVESGRDSLRSLNRY